MMILRCPEEMLITIRGWQGAGSVRGLDFLTGHVSQLLGIMGSAMGVSDTLVFRALGYFCHL